MKLNTKEQQNLKLIKKIKNDLSQVRIKDFAASIGRSRQAVNKLLSPKRAAATNTESLLTLENQVSQYIKEHQQDIEERIQSIIN